MTRLFLDIQAILTPQDWGSFAWGYAVSFIVCFVLFCAILFFMSASEKGRIIDEVFERHIRESKKNMDKKIEKEYDEMPF